MEATPVPSTWVKMVDQSVDAKKAIEAVSVQHTACCAVCRRLMCTCVQAAGKDPVLDTLRERQLKTFSMPEVRCARYMY